MNDRTELFTIGQLERPAIPSATAAFEWVSRALRVHG